MPSIETGQCGADQCVSCPAGACTYECAFDQYYDEQCLACSDDCTEGCQRPTDCRNCSQSYCADCSLYATCDACITGASPGDSGECECDEGLQYLVDLDICGECIHGCEICDDSTTCI